MTYEYIAGFIDGEGCISMTSNPNIIVTQCNEEVLSKMCEFTGLGAVYDKKMPRNDKWRQAWQWKIGGKQAIEMLERIAALLVLKKPEAELMLENKDLFNKYQKQTEEVLSRKADVKAELKRLKRL